MNKKFAEFKDKSPKYIATTLMFYSFIVCMLIFAIFRFCGLFYFSKDYESLETSEVVYRLITGLYHCLEGYLILKILTDKKWYVCLPFALAYTIIAKFVNNSMVSFLLDTLFTFSIPFIFNKDKDKSIIKSSLFMLVICIYQMVMSFGRYSVDIINKFDLFYAIVSTIDYKLFLVSILLFIKRRNFYVDKNRR